MNNDNIEELLQQYGEDRRQQMRAAEHVRKLSRRAARIRRTAACLFLLLAAGAVAIRLRQPEAPTPLVAETHHTAPVEEPLPATAQAPDEALSSTAQAPADAPRRAAAPAPAHAPAQIAMVLPAAVCDTLSPTPIPSSAEPVPVLETPAPTAPLPTAPVPAPADLLLPHPAITDMPLAMAETPAERQKPSRFRFTAGVGASLSGNTLSGSSYEVAEAAPHNNWCSTSNSFAPNSFDGSSDATFTYTTPSNAVSAHVAVAYALVQNQRSRFDIGLGLGGYSQQNDMMRRNMHIDAATKQFSTSSSNYQASVQSLFASMPLTLLTHLRGSDRPGWQFSITPARQIAATRPDGTSAFNPWKLTLGVGISLPNSWIHAVSLTANMLPTYTNQTMHEFGIRIEY